MNESPILLVEDNPADVELTLLAFKRAQVGNEIVVARDGVEALELLLCPDERGRLAPALILLDLNLPRIDGLECLRRLRADPATEFVPVVVMTSSDEERDMLESYRHRANSYVRKPIEFQAFHEAAKHIGIYWLAINQVPADAGRAAS